MPDNPDQSGAPGIESISDEEPVAKIPSHSGPECVSSFQTYLKEKGELTTTIDRPTEYRSPPGWRNDPYLSELPEDAVLSSIVDPLSPTAVCDAQGSIRGEYE
jgi:hypothetical protein